MAISRINETDLQGKLVSELSNRPTDPRSAGGDGMTAKEVKARQDALGLLVKDKLNALIDALNNEEDNTPLADLITVVADGVSKSLTEWIEAKLTMDGTAGEGIHAYGVDDDGEQIMLPVKDTATAGAIPQYGTGGVLPVADGTADGHAVAKGQMATAITEAINNLSTTLTALISAKYTKPDGGIPADDLAGAVKAILDSAVSQSEFAPVKALAEGADQARAFENYSALVYNLVNTNAVSLSAFKVGQKIFVKTANVPDVWIYAINDTPVLYTYTTDAAFEAALVAGTLQVGYFTLAPVEGKTNLTGYATETYVGNAIAGNIDTDLDTAGKSADAKAVGDAIDALIDALVDGVMQVAEAAYAESATYAQQADLANQINTDREIEDADTACPPIVFGTVGGNAEVQNGLMKFPELLGHTIKWNQLCYDPNCTDATVWNTYDSTYAQVVSVSNNEIEVEIVQNDASAQYNYMVKEKKIDRIGGVIGHKYVFWAEIFSAKAGTFVVSPNNDSTPATGSVSSNTWTKIIGINTASRVMRYMSAYPNFEPDIGDTYKVRRFGCCDLTSIYGSGNEPSTVAEFVRDFPMPYYPYNAGTLLSSKSSSVDFVKRNQWDEQWEVGSINPTTGENVVDNTRIRSKNYICILPNTSYYQNYITGRSIQPYFYDGDKNLISYADFTSVVNPFTTPANAVYMRFIVASAYGTTYNHDICIYINWDTPGLPYVAYSKQHITLPNLELRSAGSAYDVAYQEGGGKRRIGTVDLGTLNWAKDTVGDNWAFYVNNALPNGKIPTGSYDAFNGICERYEVTPTTPYSIDYSYNNVIFLKPNGQLFVVDKSYSDIATFKAAMSGVMLYYELATETDITTDENPGWDEYADIDNFGTVKFNQDPAQDIPVPQAYFVRYTVNLVEFLDSVGERAGFDAGNIALLEDIIVPDAPTTDGSYTLKVTVSSGTPTYSWVADE